MAYRRKTVDKYQLHAVAVLLVGVVITLIIVLLDRAIDQANAREFYNPYRDLAVVEKTVVVDRPDENIDAWIREAAAKYQNASYPESYLKYQLHCLANKESGHRYDDHTKCGDNNASCGLFQYKQATWNGFRKIMIKQGLATEIGSLWDNELQVETTAWALSEGRHQNWGPWSRGECR